MKSRFCLVILSGVALSLMTVQLGAGNWSITSPNDNDRFSTNSDVPVAGSGPVSTQGTFKLVQWSSGLTQDSFIIMTGDPETSFEDQFDIQAAWPQGMHSIDIYEGTTRVYGNGTEGIGEGVDVQFAQSDE